MRPTTARPTSTGSRSVLATTAVLAAALAVAGPAAANDSTAELGLGGLTLTRSADVVMQSEQLFVSQDRITVDYVFLDTSARDVETVVAFPLPDVVNGIEKPAYDFTGDLDFRTTVDGVPVELKTVQTAVFEGRDVTARLRELKLPIMPVWETFDRAMKALPAATAKELEAIGLVVSDGTPEHPSWSPMWTTRTAVTRTQTFPAGRPVRVSHSYKPFVGGSVGSILKADLRNQADFRADVAAYRAKFCIDDDFVRGFDATQGKDRGALRPDVWIAYVLTSGANWKGPIRDFRLVVDKGDPNNLVSFCATGVKKIAPTRFEVHYENFTPTQDLNVLIVRPPFVP